MKVYEVTIENYEPLLITSVGYGKFMKHEAKYLPGSVVRGAILTLLKTSGSKRVQEEIEEPSIIFHPAYPLARGNIQTKPAHPLIYKCKICGQVFSLSLKEVVQKIDEFKVPMECKNGHMYAVVSLGGSLIYQYNDRFEQFSPRYMTVDAIGINRTLRTTEVGLLYSYLALAPRQAFKGLIVDPYDRLEGMVEEVGLKLSYLELKIGRRKSAGFGGVKVKISELKDYRQRIMRRIEGYKEDVCLLAKSPIFNLGVMEVDGQDKVLSLSEESIRQLRNLRIKLVLKTGIAIASGFSLPSGTPKVRLYGLDIGSLIVIDGVPKIEDLINAELMGVGPFSIAGFNIVEAMKVDQPIP